MKKERDYLKKKKKINKKEILENPLTKIKLNAK